MPVFKVEDYLYGDPSFEHLVKLMGVGSLSVSCIERDEFEATLVEGGPGRKIYRVLRRVQTVVGSMFDIAIDEKEGQAIVTADVPSKT